MRANWNFELRREQQYRERLVESAQAASVELAEIDRTSLHQLLEHHAIGRMLAGRNSNRSNRASNRGETKDIVGTGRLFDPQRLESRERTHEFDRLVDIPRL